MIFKNYLRGDKTFTGGNTTLRDMKFLTTNLEVELFLFYIYHMLINAEM